MDDFSFGNVWGDDSSPKPLPPADLLPSSSRLHNEVPTELVDDFDAFDDTMPNASSVPVATTFGDEDDFGDFGDFGDAPLETDGLGGFGDDDGFSTSSNAFASTSFASPIAQKDWQPLGLDPLPSLQDLTEQVNALLEPLWDERLSDAVWSGESIRQVEGIGQILVTPERLGAIRNLLR